jgi:hypothetical protein
LDGSRFDGWTRRSFGLAIGGVAALIGLGALDDATARKKKKKKKRCKKFDTGCNPTGKKKRCKGLACEESPTGGNRCCKKLQTKCTNENECCDAGICEDIVGLDGRRCCHDLEKFCENDRDCCEGFICDEPNNKCLADM